MNNALILLLMFREQRYIRLTEAGKALGVAASTAHRLLDMLEHHRFVRHDAVAGAYAAGSALTEVGLSVVKKMNVRSIARPLLERLREQTGETVHLAALEGSTVRFLDCVESHQTLRVTSRTGRTLPAHCTSVGKAIQAQLSTEQLHMLYPDEELPTQTSRSIGTRSRLEQELDDVRRNGYARNSSESEDGVGSVGMFVPSAGRGPAIGISVAAPLSRLGSVQLRRTVKALRETVRVLSEQLGSSPGVTS